MRFSWVSRYRGHLRNSTHIPNTYRYASLPLPPPAGSDQDASELASFTPSFLWLLRDFYLRLEEDGRQVTPRDYLETALQPLPGSGRAVEAKNQVRGVALAAGVVCCLLQAVPQCGCWKAGVASAAACGAAVTCKAGDVQLRGCCQ